MGRQKDIYMDIKEQELAQQETSTNQLNNKMEKKTMQEKLKKQPQVVKETREEALRRLFIDNNMVKEDAFKSPMGFAIITRTGIDKIVSKNNITVAYEVVKLEGDDDVVIKAVGTMKDKDGAVRNMMSFGETNLTNYPVKKTKKGNIVARYPVAMAEKRAMSRVVLKLTGFYEQGAFGQDEIIDVDDN